LHSKERDDVPSKTHNLLFLLSKIEKKPGRICWRTGLTQEKFWSLLKMKFHVHKAKFHEHKWLSVEVCEEQTKEFEKPINFLSDRPAMHARLETPGRQEDAPRRPGVESFFT